MTRLFPIGILSLLPAVAWAQEKPTIAVVGIHQAELFHSAQLDATTKLAAAIDAGGTFDGLDHDPVATALLGREQITLDEAVLAPGRRALDDGRVLYEQAQIAEAIPLFQDAVASLKAGMPVALATKELWDALVYLGTAHLSNDEVEPATAAYAEAVALSPARSPNPATFPPNVLELYEKIRQEKQAQASVVTVVTDPAGALVSINGQERGAAPAVLQGVVPGPAHVVAKGEQATRAYQLVEVPASGATTVTLKLGEATLGTGAETRFGRSRQTTALYRSLGARAQGVSYVLLAGVGEGQLQLQLYAPKTDTFSLPVSVAYEGSADDEALAALPQVLAYAQADGAISAQNAAANAIPLDIGSNRLVAQMLLDPRPPEAPPVIVQQGGSGRWIALGLVGAGAVGAATGTAIWLTSDPGTSEEVQRGTIVVGPLE